MHPELSPDAARLLLHVEQAAAAEPDPQAETYHIAEAAGSIYLAYEHLRNAAEYNQRHLLQRAAIERFFRRSLYLPSPADLKLADDLVVELTHARYIKNDSIPLTAVKRVDNLIAYYASFYELLTKKHQIVPDVATRWTYQVMSVAIERTLSPQPYTDAFIDFAYHHYLGTVSRRGFKTDESTFEAALYFAVHRALMNADRATARAYWLSMRCGVSPTPTDFIAESRSFDQLFDAPRTNRLVRLVNRYGAPMRSLRELLAVHKGDFPAVIRSRGRLFTELESIISKQYDSSLQFLISSVIRAVIFVFISKMLIGLAIEIPYDLFAVGSVEVVPLIINLAAPPLYMASVLLSLRRPTTTNTSTILSYAERIVYHTGKKISYTLGRNRRWPAWFNVLYGVMFVIPLALMAWLLATLHFNIVHGVIFFVFMSVVSFLRFRLLQSLHELEIVRRPHTMFGAIADFFYVPFIRLGYFLSDRYSRLNIMTFLLDMAIELPLKTTLRLLRQWIGFMNDKRDEI